MQRQLSEENLAYLKYWITAAQKDNTFIYKVIVDAAKASNYIQDRLGLKNELTQAKKYETPSTSTHEEISKRQDRTKPLSRYISNEKFSKCVLNPLDEGVSWTKTDQELYPLIKELT